MKHNENLKVVAEEHEQLKIAYAEQSQRYVFVQSFFPPCSINWTTTCCDILCNIYCSSFFAFFSDLKQASAVLWRLKMSTKPCQTWTRCYGDTTITLRVSTTGNPVQLSLFTMSILINCKDIDCFVAISTARRNSSRSLNWRGKRLSNSSKKRKPNAKVELSCLSSELYWFLLRLLTTVYGSYVDHLTWWQFDSELTGALKHSV